MWYVTRSNDKNMHQSRLSENPSQIRTNKFNDFKDFEDMFNFRANARAECKAILWENKMILNLNKENIISQSCQRISRNFG